MRDTKTVEIEGRDKAYKVKELTLREWRELLTESFATSDFVKFFSNLQTEIIPKCTNIKAAEVLEFTPSELDQVYQAFREVNAAFFNLWNRLGLKNLFEEIKPALLGACGAFAVDWLKRVMSDHGTMASDTFSMPSESMSDYKESDLPQQRMRHELPSEQTKSSGSSSSKIAASCAGGGGSSKA